MKKNGHFADAGSKIRLEKTTDCILVLMGNYT